MDKETIIQEIVAILKHTIAEALELTMEEGTISEELQVNSLVFLQLLTDVEKRFSIQIEDDYWEYNKLSSIEKIAQYVMEHNTMDAFVQE